MVELKNWKFMLNDKVLQEGVLPESLKQSLILLIERFPNSVSPPKDLSEFEDRLMELMDELYKDTYGSEYFLNPDKYLKRDPTFDNLIKIGIEHEKRSKGKLLLINQDSKSPYQFLKEALEDDYPFSKHAQNYIGIYLDRSTTTYPKKRSLGVQAAAQVLWFERKGSISSIKEMRQEIWKHKS